MSTNSIRSPVKLRSHTVGNQSQKSSNILQSKSARTSIGKIPSPKISQIKNQPVKKTLNDLSEMSELKQMIETQKRSHETAIKNIHAEIATKYTIFEEFMKSYEGKMLQIKNNQSDFAKLLHTLNASRFNFAMPIGFNKPINDMVCYEAEFSNNELPALIIDALSLKIDEVEERISCFEKTVLEIAKSMKSIIDNTKIIEKEKGVNVITEKLNYVDMVDTPTFINTIKCLQDEINRMNIAIHSNEEKTEKINLQLHVLSAKFIDFNAKINNHIHDLNRFKIQTIDADQVLDMDALPFIEKSQRNLSQFANKFCFRNSAINRFIGRYDSKSNSESIIVRIEYASVTNLTTFKQKLWEEFEQRTGNNSVQNITIKKCKINENVAHRIDVVISFYTSLNHGYLNEIAFPTNWTFFVFTISKSLTKYPLKRKHMTRTQQRSMTASEHNEHNSCTGHVYNEIRFNRGLSY